MESSPKITTELNTSAQQHYSKNADCPKLFRIQKLPQSGAGNISKKDKTRPFL